MPLPPDLLALRRCALAVSVLHDLDLWPTADGISLTRPPQVDIGWTEVRRALVGEPPETPPARERLADWLRLRRWLADTPATALARHARPYGIPVTSPRHPGLDWIRLRVLGDALDVGLGFAGVDPQEPERVWPAPVRLLDGAGLDTDRYWPVAADYLDRMGRNAVARLARRPDTPVRPMGDCDVVTLLGSRDFREALAAGAQGMRPMAVPMRTRGWFELSRIDPAFVVAAAAATDERDRGFPRPLLVTVDEVVMAPEGGHAAELALRDPVVQGPWPRDVRYH